MIFCVRQNCHLKILKELQLFTVLLCRICLTVRTNHINMNPVITENTYTLLAFFLSPWKKTDDIKTLQKLIRKEPIPWEQLLFQANNNLCTPLWYVCLKNDGFLNLLPVELRKYLLILYEANLERNAFFMDALFELHKKFVENFKNYFFVPEIDGIRYTKEYIGYYKQDRINELPYFFNGNKKGLINDHSCIMMNLCFAISKLPNGSALR